MAKVEFRLKILQLIPRLASGGAERFVVDLSNELSKSNEVHLYTLKSSNEDNIYLSSVKKSVNVGHLNMKRWVDPLLLLRLYKVIRTIKPNVIHTHGRAFHYVLMLKLFGLRCSIVNTVHNSAAKELHREAEHRAFRFFYAKNSITPVLISRESISNFEILYPGVNIVQILNGRSFPEQSNGFQLVRDEVNGFKIDSETRIFVNVARLSPPKNHSLLINAFKRLISENANAVLIIIGRDIPFHKESQEIKELVLRETGDHIKWIGEKSNATDYLYLADFFCLSSKSEAMPISLIEAMAVGCIPICTPVGEIPVMIDDDNNGFLSDDCSVDSYFAAINRAYQSSLKKRYKMKDVLKDLYRKKYSIEASAENYIKLYKTFQK